MATELEIKEALRKAVLEAYSNEYKELSDTWRGLETKAQGSIAIAGIFIAGAFAYIRDITPNAYRHEKLFLLIAIICLVISVVLSILVLKIRTIAAPPMGEYIDRVVQDILRLNKVDELPERLVRFDNDQIAAWRIVKNEAQLSNMLKARYLWRAQIFLMSAIVTVAILMTSRIIEGITLR